MTVIIAGRRNKKETDKEEKKVKEKKIKQKLIENNCKNVRNQNPSIGQKK